MKKKTLSIVLALAVTLGLSFIAIARTAATGGTVNIDPIANLELTQEELTHEVTGYVDFESSNDGPKLESLKLEVQKENKNWTTIDFKDYDEATGRSDELTERSNAPGIEFNFADWTIKAEGTYELRVTATFTDSYSKAQASTIVEVTLDADKPGAEDEDSDDDEADTLSEDGDNCPAAPAIAGKILKELGINNHYNGGNYIADIAKEMGPNGEFQGVQKSDTEDYAAQIRSYLENHDAWGLEITKENHQNQADKEWGTEKNNNGSNNKSRQ